jgi:hypothetical protein
MTAPRGALSAGALQLQAQQALFQQAIVSQQNEPAPAWRVRGDRPALLGIYQFAYRARLGGALRDNFPVLPRVMGDEAFDALAAAYLQAHPSRHPSIRWYGDQLADFMRRQEEGVLHPALTDLARMEWALRAAFDAADAEPLTPASLAGVPPDAWPRLVLSLHPSVQAVPLDWAVEPVWQALKDVDESDPAHADGPEWPEPQARAHVLVVWRVGLDTRWRSLEAADAAGLLALQTGQTFAGLCDLAAQQVGEADAAGAVVAALQAWLADGWLAAWHLADRDGGPSPA